MLLEVLTYLTTPCPQPFRRMGYLKELIATEARHRRCRDAWQRHLERTRAIIADAARSATGTQRAVVIGAGMLADIPLELLAKKFRAVDLVDVCFSKQTRRVVWRHPHIELRACDVTGVAATLTRGELPEPDLPEGLVLGDADLVVSANVLSQLPLIPLQFLKKTQPDLSDDTRDRFAAAIIRRHLALLETCPGTICLVTEVERRFVDGDRNVGTEDPLMGADLPGDGGEEWLWELAPRHEVSPDYAVVNRVRAVVRQGGVASHPAR